MAFAPSKSAKHHKKEKGGLIIYSLLDMMTLILMFLLKVMSMSGGLVKPSPYVQLPESNRTLKTEKAVSILVSDAGVFEDMERNPRMLSDAGELQNAANVELPGLKAYLVEHREFNKQIGVKFKGQVTIQCDKAVPYEKVLRVINTCGQAEYGTIDFIVKKTVQKV
jgi:biopolymer transport protein ExbD